MDVGLAPSQKLDVPAAALFNSHLCNGESLKMLHDLHLLNIVPKKDFSFLVLVLIMLYLGKLLRSMKVDVE